MSDERPIEDILDTIGDEYARRVLAVLSDGPLSAKEIKEETDLSLPTIYRRVELLKEHGLVAEQMMVAQDGNHFRTFDCNFNSTVIFLSEQEFDVRIYRTENLPEKFSELWDDLSRGSA